MLRLHAGPEVEACSIGFILCSLPCCSCVLIFLLCSFAASEMNGLVDKLVGTRFYFPIDSWVEEEETISWVVSGDLRGVWLREHTALPSSKPELRRRSPAYIAPHPISSPSSKVMATAFGHRVLTSSRYQPPATAGRERARCLHFLQWPSGPQPIYSAKKNRYVEKKWVEKHGASDSAWGLREHQCSPASKQKREYGSARGAQTTKTQQQVHPTHPTSSPPALSHDPTTRRPSSRPRSRLCRDLADRGALRRGLRLAELHPRLQHPRRLARPLGFLRHLHALLRVPRHLARRQRVARIQV